MNPLWARYMHHQGASVSQFNPVMCRPQLSMSNASAIVSPPVSSLSNAIDRAKFNGKLLPYGKCCLD